MYNVKNKIDDLFKKTIVKGTNSSYLNSLLCYTKNNYNLVYEPLLVLHNIVKREDPDVIITCNIQETKNQFYTDDVDIICRKVDELNTVPYNRLGFSGPYDNIPNIYIINTSTNLKIAEIFKYILQKVDQTENLQELSVLLCTEKDHKIKAIKHKSCLIVATNRINETFLRTLYTLAPKIFGYIDKLTDEEKTFFNEILEANGEDIETTQHLFKIFAEDIENLDKEDFFNLKEIFMHNAENSIKNLETRKTSLEGRIENYYQDISGMLKQLSDIRTQIFEKTYLFDSTEEQAKENATELLDFLKTSPVLLDISTYKTDSYGDTDIKLKMLVKTPIKYYEKEPLERILSNPNWKRNALDGRASEDTMNKLTWVLRKTFLDEEFEINTIANILVNLTNPYLTNENISIEMAKQYNALPHPHLERFNCFGENKTTIYTCIGNQMYLSAVNQIIGACYNFNFTDAAVLRHFCEMLLRPNRTTKCFRNIETNELFSFVDLLELYEKERIFQDIYYSEYKGDIGDSTEDYEDLEEDIGLIDY